jgi:hypothetical protein
MTSSGDFKEQSCSHLYLFRKFWGFDNSLFWKCNTFQSWCSAYACAVRCSWCTLEWLGYPQNELVIEKTITCWEGVCVASYILTTKIPSAPLVAIMWLQRTWRPRFCHGTFSYGMTTSPNTKDRVWDIENTPSVCMLVHPRFPMHMLCKCMLKKRHNYLFIYSFISKVVSKTMRIGSDWKFKVTRTRISIRRIS